MDFEFSEEQVAIRDTIRELVQDRVAPRAAEIDAKAEYPKDIEKLFAENGILGIPFPEQYGGISGSSVTICMGVEEIAKACATSSLILAVPAPWPFSLPVPGAVRRDLRLERHDLHGSRRDRQGVRNVIADPCGPGAWLLSDPGRRV